MKNISVVLSSSTNFRNTGMFSVDYAAYKFFTANFPNAKLNFYVYGLSDEKYYPYEDIMPYGIYNDVLMEPYKIIDLYNSDLIVYWGDFHHTRHFLEGYVMEYLKPNKWELDLFYNLFFLSNAPDNVFKRTITFGNSLVFLDEKREDKGDDYHLNFIRFYSSIYCSSPRDKVSCRNLMNTVDYCDVSLGCDAAFLIPPTEHPKEYKLGLFVGRRCEIKPEEINPIINFANDSGLEVEWIPWMVNVESLFMRAIKKPEQALNLFRHWYLSKRFGKKKLGFENDFNSLSRYSMVVTDTYHVAVNAIREGVPVFCISHDKVIYDKNEIELHDKKKGILYASLSLFYSCGIPTVSDLVSTHRISLQNNKFLNDHLKQIKTRLKSTCIKILENK